MYKPLWLNKKVDFRLTAELKCLLRDLGLHTVCEEARCPNISECFHRGVATFLILGDICTRNCTFCNVKKGVPSSVDEEEPLRVKEAVRRLGTRHIVITSPTRDDLPDGGAGIYRRLIQELKGLPFIEGIEVLIPDFRGDYDSLAMVVEASPTVIGHNLETVPSLYARLRPAADYKRSLEVLHFVKKKNPDVFTKSGIMLGLGEKRDEVISLFDDLRGAGCDFLSIGQYLAPSSAHYPVQRFVSPAEFRYYEGVAESMGFKAVKSAPYTRSSYMADTYFNFKQ